MNPKQTAKKAAMVFAVTGAAVGVSAGPALADSGAEGVSKNSPGVVAGNTIQVPVHVPVQVSGNSINVIGILNPAIGNAAESR